jgi:hypothetical protein
LSENDLQKYLKFKKLFDIQQTEELKQLDDLRTKLKNGVKLTEDESNSFLNLRYFCKSFSDKFSLLKSFLHNLSYSILSP